MPCPLEVHGVELLGLREDELVHVVLHGLLPSGPLEHGLQAGVVVEAYIDRVVVDEHQQLPQRVHLVHKVRGTHPLLGIEDDDTDILGGHALGGHGFT